MAGSIAGRGSHARSRPRSSAPRDAGGTGRRWRLVGRRNLGADGAIYGPNRTQTGMPL
jgi:hypothetical protein